MSYVPIKSIGWLGSVAIGLGGANLTLYTLNSLVSTQGTIVVFLFAFAFLLTHFTSFGYIELVLMYPQKIGGIAPACSEAFQAYSPILTNIIGVGYWFAWLMAASFAAIYASTILQQFLPWISINWFSTFLIVCVASLHLCGLTWVQRFAIPIAAIAAFLAVAAILIPVFTGHVTWSTSFHYNLIVPFPDQFGQISGLMSALYLIGWIVPGYECTLCYVGETLDARNNVKRAMFISMILAGLYYVLAPTVWLGVIGPENIVKDLAGVLGPVYAPLLGKFANLGIAWFIVFNMLICLFAPLGGPPRTLAQLAKDGLLPEFFSLTSRFGVPWVAILLTTFISILTIWLGAPTWLIAATNFQYLLCISAACVAVWILRGSKPDAPRLYRAPTVYIYLGLFAACIWTIATIMGFRQYGLSTIIIGISFAFIGVPLYFWRKINDRIKKNLPTISFSLHLKLTGTLLSVLIFDTIGYLIAIHSINIENTYNLAILEDIFVIVALLTLTAGLIIPGMVVYAAESVNDAAKRIIKINLAELSAAMEALRSGNLNQYNMTADIIPISIFSHDEIGQMAKSFNLMQEEIKKTSVNLNDVRSRLRKAIEELTDLNLTLEKRVEERTEKLTTSNIQLKKEIVERIKAESKIRALHNQLMIASRQAGMADIATSTLHNVGNFLNSVNTSTEMLQKYLNQSGMENLYKISNLFKQHENEIVTFLTESDNGRLIPKYLISLANEWSKNKEYLIGEIQTLKKSVSQINKIITTQQSLGKTLELTEDIKMNELIKDAMSIILTNHENKDIQIIYEFESLFTIKADRVKLLQVIVNLIKNATTSVLESKATDKRIALIMKKRDDQFFELQVCDNGIGINPDDIDKIFTPGFATKEEGYGFSLHTNALAAKEMGGSLNAENVKYGTGTIFILCLPFIEEDKEAAN